jgi:ABC-type phosphate transport system substrate-binding protein
MSKNSIMALLLAALGLFGATPASGQKADVAVVVNSENLVSALTLAELRKTFTGEKHTWPGGTPIRLVVRESGTHEQLVLMKLLRMSQSDYKQYWTAQLLRGEASSAPVVVPSVGMQKEALETFRGGITLLDAKDVKPGMKVIKIDGRLPGEPDYPVR